MTLAAETTFWNRVLIHLGVEVCERCGSKFITQQGYDHNRRYLCENCGKVTVVSWI